MKDIIISIVYVNTQRKIVPLDTITWCPKKGPWGYTVVLIDKTDPFSIPQKAYLRRHFNGLKDKIPKYTELSIYVISNKYNIEFKKPRLRKCNPGDGSDASSINQNPEMIRKRWVEQFSDPIEEILSELLAPTVSPQSPILEMIQMVNLVAFPIVNSKKHGELKGLMIQTPSFPGWEDFGSFISHLKFVKDNQSRIKKVAAVSDSRFLTIMPKVVNHFVGAEVKHFQFEDKSKAQRWLEN